MLFEVTAARTDLREATLGGLGGDARLALRRRGGVRRFARRRLPPGGERDRRLFPHLARGYGVELLGEPLERCPPFQQERRRHPAREADLAVGRPVVLALSGHGEAGELGRHGAQVVDDDDVGQRALEPLVLAEAHLVGERRGARERDGGPAPGGDDEPDDPDARALERVQQRPLVHPARHRQRSRELGQRRGQGALVAGLAGDAAGERDRARELAGHLHHLAAHVLHVEEGGAQVVSLGLEGAPLDDGRTIGVLGGGELARRVGDGRGGRGGGGRGGAQRLCGRGLGSGRLALFVRLAGDLAAHRLVLRGEALLLAGERLAAAVQPRRRRQRALARHGKAVEGHAPLAHRGARGLQLGGGPRVPGLRRLQLLRQAALLLRPRLVVAFFRPAGQLGDEALALGRRGALHLVEEVLALLGEAAHALEPAVQHPSAQQSPGAALALGELPGERLFLARPGGRHPRQPAVVRRALGVDGGELVTPGLQVGVEREHVAGQQPPACLGDLALHGAHLLGRRGLAAQRCELRAHLALQQQGALEVPPHLSQLQLRALTTPLVRAQPGGLLDLAAPVLGLARQERLDLALADDGVQFLAQADLGQQFDDVREPAGGLVDRVVGRAVSRDAAHHADLRRGQRQRAVRVVEGELDLRGAARAAPVAAGEDDVLHGRAADGSGTLLAERPDDRVGQVALAAPVGPDDHADAGLEEELGLLGERLEAFEAQRLEVHLS